MHNFYIEWNAVAASGIVESQFRQTISAPDLPGAMMVFEAQRGSLAPDENGVCLVIVCISWQPVQEEV